MTNDEAMKWEGIQILCEARKFAYNLLRNTFIQEPSREFIDLLERDEVILSFPFAEDNQEIGAGVDQVNKYLERYTSLAADARGEELERLRWDYTRMFVGPYQLPAPPWESAYLNDERLLFQEETLAVRRIYLRYGFIPRNYHQEADDHLGMELEFMFRLSEMVAGKVAVRDTVGAEAILKDQEVFMADHLLKWVPRFAGDVMHSSATDFYQGMASLLKGFIYLDRQAIAELLQAIA
ncbi:TorD/DmsD family molecular chaperone [Neomoorella thermoacetica]|uniref:TorD/DmsD family molecular chaperone n=1 Tax=Neomoorella thermoacetica TaxID=1525 RepID=UPI0008FA775C|nr:molecular chaperone TorD family protein [Moorella thermoacetica]OIQ11472.1 Tat proofreading chaperone DmsD [Moorella thermoacetica]